MKFLLRQWYNISVIIGAIILVCAVIFWNKMTLLQGLALLNLAVINFHFFEEFGFPGGFPKFCNTIFAMKNSPAPDRYPLNQLGALLINWGTAIFLYLPPFFFPNAIWLGLVPILFGGVAQLIMHGILNNIILKRCYNAGLAAVVLGHIPIAVVYINYIITHNLSTIWDWVISIIIMVVWYGGLVRFLLPKYFAKINSPYPFDETEMNRFKE